MEESAKKNLKTYGIFFGIIILMITLVLIFVKYGAGLTGTEANVYYNGGLT